MEPDWDRGRDGLLRLRITGTAHQLMSEASVRFVRRERRVVEGALWHNHPGSGVGEPDGVSAW